MRGRGGVLKNFGEKEGEPHGDLAVGYLGAAQTTKLMLVGLTQATSPASGKGCAALFMPNHTRIHLLWLQVSLTRRIVSGFS